jgi:hypothetical protein
MEVVEVIQKELMKVVEKKVRLFGKYSLVRLRSGEYAIVDRSGEAVVLLTPDFAEEVARQEGVYERAKEVFQW